MTHISTDADAMRFAEDWTAAWNSHDLERILDHYSEDVTLTSPLVARILGAGRDTVRGRPSLRAYFQSGLEAYPDLTFRLWGAYRGIGSVVVHYESVRGLPAAELMRFDESGRVCEVLAHYGAPAIS